MPLDPLDLAAIGTDLQRLAELLRDARMQIPGRAAEQFAAERDQILEAFDCYLEPRIGAPDAPIVAAIVGSSGVGKSTILNSIARDRVSMTSVVRPTTRVPAVWADADHEDEYWVDFSDRVASHLGDRVTSVLQSGPMTEHLTVIDTPPLDMAGGDTIAAKAIVLADLCIFVTTPTRYADGSAWSFLRRTWRRGIPILFVLNRLPTDIEEQGAILRDFATQLHRRNLLTAPDSSLLFGIAEGVIEVATMGLPDDAVSAIRKELAEVGDPVYRNGLVDETVYATARMVAERARALTRPMAAEAVVAESLLRVAANAYEREASALDELLSAGEFHEVAQRESWPDAAADLAGSVTRRAGVAAQAVAADWATQPEARELVEQRAADLWRHGHETTSAAVLALESWQSGLEALVATHARTRFLWSRRGPRAVDAVWRAALNPDSELPARVGRWFRGRSKDLVTTAKSELSAALRTGLAHDAERFARHVGDPSEHDVYAAIVEQADVVDSRLDDMAARLSSAWIEAGDSPEVVDLLGEAPIAIEIATGSTVIELGGAGMAPGPPHEATGSAAASPEQDS